MTEKRQEGEETGRMRDNEWERLTKNKRHKRGRKRGGIIETTGEEESESGNENGGYSV